MSETLKPCPVCDGKANLNYETDQSEVQDFLVEWWYVDFEHKEDCIFYGAESESFDTEEEAIDACNKRSDHYEAKLKPIKEFYKENKDDIIRLSNGSIKNMVIDPHFLVIKMIKAIKEAVEE